MSPSPAPSNEYEACLQALFRLHRFGIKLGLDLIATMLAGIGDPQRRFRTIHVAGTNGKGSVAAGLAAVLQACGLHVGLYTSPHLVKFNERIRIDGREVSDEAVVAAHRALQDTRRLQRQPTFFEVATAMAFHLFAQHGVQWAVVETGMGGRLDATNVITPELALITNISLEHRAYLGKTIAAIAGEKAGIVKPGVPLVTGIRQPAARRVVEATADRLQAPLFQRGTHFTTRRGADGAFTYRGLRHTWRGLRTGLLGAHQVENAGLVLAACEVLQQRAALPISHAQAAAGLAATRWPGRLEVVRHEPLVILDGAHNLAAVRKLATFLRTELAGRRVTLVAGILDDKPYQSMLAVLLPLCRRAVFAAPRIARALPAETLLRCAAGRLPDLRRADSVGSALRAALESAEAHEAILVAGSLYVVGEAKEWIAAHPERFATNAAAPIGA